MTRPQRVVLVVAALALLGGCGDDNPSKPPGATRRTLSFALQPAIATTNLASMTTGDFNEDGSVDIVATSAETHRRDEITSCGFRRFLRRSARRTPTFWLFRRRSAQE